MQKFLLLLILCGCVGFSHADDMADASRHFSNKEYQQAKQIYSRLAMAGSVDAQVLLGEMYWYGDGTPVDEKNAELWFKKAAENGNLKAQQFLNVMTQRAKRKSEIEYYMSGFDGREVKMSAVDCPRPNIPSVSKTNEEINRVAVGIDFWMGCYNRFVERLNSALPAGKDIPKDLALLMNEEEMNKAIFRMDKIYSMIASDTQKLAAEILEQQKIWKSATGDFVVASNKEVEVANALFKRQVEEENERIRVNTIFKSKPGDLQSIPR